MLLLTINLKGVYIVTRAVLPEMIERKSVDIVNIYSTVGQKGASDGMIIGANGTIYVGDYENNSI